MNPLKTAIVKCGHIAKTAPVVEATEAIPVSARTGAAAEVTSSYPLPEPVAWAR